MVIQLLPCVVVWMKGLCRKCCVLSATCEGSQDPPADLEGGAVWEGEPQIGPSAEALQRRQATSRKSSHIPDLQNHQQNRIVAFSLQALR